MRTLIFIARPLEGLFSEVQELPRDLVFHVDEFYEFPTTEASVHLEPLMSMSFSYCLFSYRHIKCPPSIWAVRESFLQREGCSPCRPLASIQADFADKCSQYSWTWNCPLYKFLPAAIYADIHRRDHNRQTRQNISHVFPIYRLFRPVTGLARAAACLSGRRVAIAAIAVFWTVVSGHSVGQCIMGIPLVSLYSGSISHKTIFICA